VDFTRTIMSIDSGTRLQFDFDINPAEYLSFAKQDRKQGGKRGKINAISNAKRAIDLQIERIFKSIGHDTENVPNYYQEFSKEYCEEKVDIPLKLRMINALGMAPISIISEIRNPRNKTEHQYLLPTDPEVRTAVEIAELFISVTERRLVDVWDFEISDSKKISKNEQSGIICWLDRHDGGIEICHYDRITHERLFYIIQLTEIEHAILFRMCFLLEQEEELLATLRYFLKRLNHPIPSNKIKIRQQNS